MICSNCGNEIGNMEQCPYCGMMTRGDTYRVSGQTTIPVQWKTGNDGGNPEDTRHLRNLDRWSLIQIILIAGIFILELLQLIFSLAY